MNRTFRKTCSFSREVIILVVFSTLMISCDKEEIQTPNNPNPTVTAYHFPITDGSYWIYQHEQTDSIGNIIAVGAIDSTFVEGDTVIGSNTFKKIRTVLSPGNAYYPTQSLTLLRDSAGYLVKPNGSFVEHTNFTDTLGQNTTPGYYYSWYFMGHEDSVVTVPAGTFQTIDYLQEVHVTLPNYPHANLRYTHQLFSDGIGTIAEIVFFLNSPDYVQRRLLRYRIQ